MILNTLRPSSGSGRFILWALLLSLLLHLLLVFSPQIDLFRSHSDELKGVDADLVSMLKVRISVTPTKTPVKSQPRSKSVLPAPSAQPTVPTGVEEAPAVAEEEIVPPSLGETSTMAEEALPVEEASSMSPQQEVAEEPYSPLNITVEYALYKGVEGMKVGKVVHTWEIGKGRYVITSVMEATGFFALLKRGMFVQSSQGRITSNGLEPEQYWEQRGQEVNRTYHAQFDYDKHTLTYGRIDESATVAFLPGTQDQLSFAYQFALKLPITGEVEFAMTNGRKLGNYRYEVKGEEVITTGVGELRTLHLSKVRNEVDDDSVDIWLAADHQYLPAKVRLTNSSGDVVEQVVAGIRGEVVGEVPPYVRQE